jgi:TonB family protein
MTATVSELLEARKKTSDAPGSLTATVSILAHGAFLAFLVFISKPKPTTFVSTSVPIRIVSPLALGRPAPPQQNPAPVLPASPPVVEPAPKAKPVIEKAERVEPPSPKALALPKSSKSKPAPPAPAPRPAASASAPAVDLPSAGGSPQGEAGGTSSFGTSVSAFDADFPFSYYVEQLLSLIGAQWLKPTVPDGTAAVVYFRIQRSGQVEGVKVETSSGLAFYDRAATRSLFAANPLPPLPPEFQGESLGVHLRFQ